jgi:hypothetical protein
MIWITYYKDQMGGITFGGAFSSEDKAKAWVRSQAYAQYMWKIHGMMIDHCWCEEFNLVPRSLDNR